jgi:hypothetical protein
MVVLRDETQSILCIIPTVICHCIEIPSMVSPLLSLSQGLHSVPSSLLSSFTRNTINILCYSIFACPNSLGIPTIFCAICTCPLSHGLPFWVSVPWCPPGCCDDNGFPTMFGWNLSPPLQGGICLNLQAFSRRS